MSIIKQKSVANQSHAENLRDYINDKNALLRDFQNLIDADNWYQEMDDIREAAGHNTASREGAKNVVMFHQIIAFLPEEADINGGIMTPDKCMEYARQYAQIRYPHQQIAFTLHKEHCATDDTYRYAVHMAINRTNLETGTRLAEGQGRYAKVVRANTIKDLDREWGLQQVEKDKVNSKLHARQPRGAEKEIPARGEKSYKKNLRQWSGRFEKQASDLEDFCRLLESVGYQVIVGNDRILVTDTDHMVNQNGDQIAFNLSRLDGKLSKKSLENTFENRPTGQTVQSALEAKSKTEAEYTSIKTEYQERLAAQFDGYRKYVFANKGKRYDELAQFRVPARPKELRNDADIQRLTLDYRNKADNLRGKLSKDAPRTAKAKNGKDRNKAVGVQQKVKQQTRTRDDIGKNSTR